MQRAFNFRAPGQMPVWQSVCESGKSLSADRKYFVAIFSHLSHHHHQHEQQQQQKRQKRLKHCSLCCLLRKNPFAMSLLFHTFQAPSALVLHVCVCVRLFAFNSSLVLCLLFAVCFAVSASCVTNTQRRRITEDIEEHSTRDAEVCVTSAQKL